MKRMRNDTWWVKVIFAMVVVSVSSIIGYAAEPVRLGIVGVYSGELSSYGISALRGVQLALEHIQAQDGILGRPIELMIEDDLCKPKEAAFVASKFVGGGVHAVIGHICSGATVAALEIYREANVIVISPSATNPVLTQSGYYPNFFSNDCTR